MYSSATDRRERSIPVVQDERLAALAKHARAVEPAADTRGPCDTTRAHTHKHMQGNTNTLQ